MIEQRANPERIAGIQTARVKKIEDPKLPINKREFRAVIVEQTRRIAARANSR